MNPDFSQAADECIALMRAGTTRDECLARYPQYARDLLPILQTAWDLQGLNVPQERIESVQTGRQRLLSAYAKKANTSHPVSESSIPRLLQRILIKLTGKEDLDMKLVARFAIALVIVIGLIIGGGITTTASASALPGDTLYPVKLSLEQINLLFANDSQVRQQLELQYQDARQQEVQSLLQLGRQTRVHFVGVLSAVNPDSWTIGGLPVRLDGGTQIVGAATLGSIVNVEGETQADGSILAHALTVQGQVNHPMDPTTSPSRVPTHEPTHPSTSMPTMMATQQSTSMPTMMATLQSTSMPTMMPTHHSTAMPTSMPFHHATDMPTMMAPHDGGHDGGGMHH
jgi:hypothetical protein